MVTSLPTSSPDKYLIQKIYRTGSGTLKIRNGILGLYLSPRGNGLILWLDEKLQTTRPGGGSRPGAYLQEGMPRAMFVTYMRSGMASLLAALAAHREERGGGGGEAGNIEFMKFLRLLHKKYPGRELHVIAENFGENSQYGEKAWLEKKSRVQMHTATNHASWLVQVETWLNLFTRDILRDRERPPLKALVGEIMRHLLKYDGGYPEPFCWTCTGVSFEAYDNP